jgi:hypothetical protein
MSALNKMMGFLGLVDTDEETSVSQAPSRQVAARPQRDRTGVTVLGTHPHTLTATQPAMLEEPASSYNIITLQPRSYSEARKVGEYYSITDPPMKFVQRFVPPLRLGGVALDLSFIVLLIAINLLQGAIRVLL